MQQPQNSLRGFTLIEAIVSIGLFMVVMTVCASALLSIIAANKQAHQTKTVMDNINFALDSMVRNIRTGSNYDCNDDPSNLNCSSAKTSFSYVSGEGSNMDDKIKYSLSSPNSFGNQQIVECDETVGCPSPLVLTDPQMNITGLDFLVSGVGSATAEPHVIIAVSGSEGAGALQTSFNLETSVTEL